MGTVNKIIEVFVFHIECTTYLFSRANESRSQHEQLWPQTGDVETLQWIFTINKYEGPSNITVSELCPFIAVKRGWNMSLYVTSIVTTALLDNTTLFYWLLCERFLLTSVQIQEPNKGIAIPILGTVLLNIFLLRTFFKWVELNCFGKWNPDRTELRE
jgi:hypothetical protein